MVPGNEALPTAETIDRVVRYFLPYHRAVAHHIGMFRREGIVPALIAMHSFTPRMNGEDRPWQVGVLWRGDQRLARPVLAALEARGDLVVGDNQPYSGLREFGFTVQFHAQRTRLPHIMFEIRQDEISPPQRPFVMPTSSTTRCARRWPIPTCIGCSRATISTAAAGLISWRHATGGSPLA